MKNTIATDNLGAIAAFVRDRDWSQTALGDRSSWSSEIQATVQILVDELDRASDRALPIDPDAMPDIFSPVVCEEDRRYDALFDSIDRGFCVCEMIFDADGKAVDYRFMQINPMFAEMTGLENAEGRTARELVPDLEEFWFQTYGNVVATGQSIRFEHQVAAINRWFDVNACPIASNQSKNRFGILFADISDRRRKEINAQFLSEIHNDLAFLSDPIEIMNAVGEKIRSFFGFSLLTFSQIDVTANTAHGFYDSRDADIPTTVTTHNIFDYFGDAQIERMKSGEIIAIDDVTIDPDIKDGGAAYSTYQVYSVINVPYLSKGEWKFWMTGSRRDRSSWRTDELELMNALSNGIYPRIERAYAEIALQEKVLELQALLDIMPVGIAIAEDPDCEIVRVNTFAQEVLSVAPDTNILATGDRAASLPFRLYRNGREIDGSESPLQLAAQRGEPIKDFEIQMVRADGITQDWLVNAIPLLDRFGQVRGSVAAIADVTKLKQIEADLRQIEEFKNRILETSPDCLKLLDSDGKLLYMNEGGISSLKIDDFSKYLHSQYLDFWQDEHRTKAEAALIKAKRGETAQFCGYCPTAKGEPRWWEVIISPIPNADNQIQQLLVNSRDISDRHRKESNDNFLAQIQKDLTEFADPVQIMSLVGEKIRVYFNFSIVTFAEVDNDDRDKVQVIYNNRETDVLDAVHTHRLSSYFSPIHIVNLNNGQVVAIADVTTDPDIKGGGADYAPFQVRSMISIPCLSKNLFKFYVCGCRREPSNWRSDESELMQELTERIYLRIERARAETAQKQRADELQAILDIVPMGIAIAEDPKCDVIRMNGFGQTMLSVSTNTNVSATGSDAGAVPFRLLQNGKEVPGEEMPMQVAAAEGRTIRDVVMQMVHIDGYTQDWLVNAIPLFNADGSVRGSVAAIADVTNLKKIEADLRQSDEFKDRLIESSPDCIELLDPDGQILYMNEGGISLLEIDDSSQYLDRQWLDFWHDEHRDNAEKALIKGKAGQVAKFYGYSATAKGTPKWWEVIISPIRNTNNQVEKLLVNSRDISDRHLRESNSNFLAEIQGDLTALSDPTEIMGVVGEKIRRFFSLSLLFFADFDADADRSSVICNHREADLLDSVADYHLPDYLGKPYLERLKAGNIVAIADVTTDPDIRDSGAAYTPFQVRSATYVPCLSQGLIKFYVSGCRREPSHWRADELILMQELVERIYLRIERARKAAALKLINQRFETVMQSVDGIIFEWDLINDSVYCSEGLVQLTGIRPQDAVLTKEWWLERIHPEDIPHIKATFANFTINTHGYQLEYRVRHEDGRWIDVWEQGQIRHNSEGKMIGLIGFTSNISDRKNAERKIRESERIYRAIGETLDYGIWINDPNGQNMYASPSFLELLGITQEEYTGLDWSKYLPPDASDLTAQVWLECVRTEGNCSIEHRFLGVDGNYHPVLVRGVPVRGDRGEIICWAGINLDISELKQTEQLLRQSEERLRLTIEGTQVGTWDQDIANNRLFWSDRMFQLFGYEPHPTGEASVETWGKCLHPEDADWVTQQWQQSLERGVRVHIEFRIIRANDRATRWVEAIGSFKCDSEGRAIRSTGVIFDISDRKFTETALIQSEERYRNLTELIPQLVWTADRQGKALDVNQRWLDFTGISTLEEAQNSGLTPFIHPDDAKSMSDRWILAQQQKTSLQAEGRIRRHDGVYRWHLHQAIPIRDDRGEIIKWFGSGTDIEVQKQLEYKYQILLQKVQERNQELDQFSHIVSHDLKAPLRGISNLAQWLEDDLEDSIPLENKQQLQLMRSRVQRMEGLINGLLSYARIGREETSLNLVSIQDLLAEILDSLDPPPTFRIEVASSLPTFSTKRMLLSQVLSNLISNAIKHHDRPDGKISVSVKESSEFYEFVITDDGKGIDLMQQKRIFDIFHTLDRDNSESTGIGLAIVKKIVETEGGEIQLTSEVGKGSTFSFTWRK